MQLSARRRITVLVIALALQLCPAGGELAAAQGGRRASAQTAARRKSSRPPTATADAPLSRYVEEGLRFAAEEKWAEAIKSYQHALVDNPKDADAYLNLGDAYLNVGRHDREAIDAYQQAVRLAPRRAETHYALGAAYNFVDQHSDAFKPLVEAIRLDPEYAEAYYGIGYAYQRLDNHKAAVGYLKSALRLKPDYPEAHLALGRAYLGLEDTRAAEAQLKTLQGLDATLARDLEKELLRYTAATRFAVQPANNAAPPAQANAPQSSAPTQQANASARQASAPAPAPAGKRGIALAPTTRTNAPPAQARNESPSPQPAPAAALLAVELSFWDSIKNTNDPAEYAAYLKKYPEGQFAELARIRLRALEAQRNGAAPQPATAPTTAVQPNAAQTATAAAVAPTEQTRPPAQESPAQTAANAAVVSPTPPNAAAAPPLDAAAATPTTTSPATPSSATPAPLAAATPATPTAAPVADAPATLAEALAFIKRYLPVKFNYQYKAPGAGPVEANIEYQLLRAEDCQLEWRDGDDTLSVALSELDPQRLNVQPRRKPDTTFSTEVWNVSLTATGDRPAFREVKGADASERRYNGVDLQYADETQARGLARALQQAVKLCTP
jgi:tetratricopeptide (TPR) repeat protein